MNTTQIAATANWNEAAAAVVADRSDANYDRYAAALKACYAAGLDCEDGEMVVGG